MSRRKKDPPPAQSGAWETYKPDQGLYWKFGGPMIPVEDIPPSNYDYGSFMSTSKPESRIKWLVEAIEKAEDDLDKASRYYRDLAERGSDAMTMQYYRDQDRQMEASPNDWTMVERNVDRHRASCYRTIAMEKNRLASYRALLAKLEVHKLPLFFGQG